MHSEKYNTVTNKYIDKSEVEARNTSKVKALISLVIPVYMEEKILESNLINFTKELRDYYSFELIVSDGGSSDRTVEIARKYADKVVVHNKKERQTIAAGRNRGAEVASGDVIVFLNGDTFPAYIEEFFDVIFKFAKNNIQYKKYSALACYVSSLPEEELFKDRVFYFLHNSYVHFLNLIGLGMGRGECQVVRTADFNKINGFRDSIVAGEDFDLFRRLSAIGKIKFEKKLHVLESPRRFRKYGYFKTVFFWTLNSLSVWFFGKSVSKEWEAVR